MNMRRSKKQVGRLFALVMPLLIGAADAHPQSQEPPDLVAIVNEANPARSISVHQLRLLYALYKRSWSGGIRVHLVLPLPETAAMEFLASEVFRQGSDWQIDVFYIQAVFAQSIPARPPQLDAEAATRLVGSKPGGIAIVERSQARNRSGLRVLEITRD